MKKFLFKPRFNRFDIYITNPIIFTLGYLTLKSSGILFIALLLFYVLVLCLLCIVSSYEEGKLEK